jgi:hypothetical protein
MADAARWLAAAEPATSLTEGAFIAALEDSQHSVMAERIANQPLTQALLAVVRSDPFEGTIGKLHELIVDKNTWRTLPKTAAHLSTALERARPSLEHIGLHVNFGPRTRKGRMIVITADEYEDRLKAVREDI